MAQTDANARAAIASPKARRASTAAALAALVFALVAFVLGSGPFSPALWLAVLALPVAAAAGCLGSWRLALAAAYWAIAALGAVPAARLCGTQIDRVLLLLAAGGIALSVWLLADFRKSAAGAARGGAQRERR